MENFVMLVPAIVLTLMVLISNEENLVHGAYAPLLEDNVSIRSDVVGRSDVRATAWADSYSDGGSCYCASTFDHGIGAVLVDTPLGPMTVKEVCDLMGVGPRGRVGRPMYNDIQCGNGPAYAIGDETECPGRTEYGKDGCKYIGPKWNFSPYLPPVSPAAPSAFQPVSTPLQVPSKVPIKPPTKSPIKPPTRIPTKQPTKRPILPPTSASIKPPSRAPTKSPVIAPIKPPSAAPIQQPVQVPIAPPARTPISSPIHVPISLPVKKPVRSPIKQPTKRSLLISTGFESIIMALRRFLGLS